MTEPMRENERIAKRIIDTSADGDNSPRYNWAEAELIKALDSKDYLIQAKEAEIERLHKFYQEANNDTLGLNQAIHEKELQAKEIKIADIQETLDYVKSEFGMKDLEADLQRYKQEAKAKEERIKELREENELHIQSEKYKSEDNMKLRTLVKELGGALEKIANSMEPKIPGIAEHILAHAKEEAKQALLLIPEELRKEIGP